MDTDRDIDLSLTAYDYPLPVERIAQTPAVPRDSAKLLVVQAETHCHQVFCDLPEVLQPGDLLVLNNTKVIPARLQGQKLDADGSLGAKAEVLLLEQQGPDQWLALVKPGRKLPPGKQIQFIPLDPQEPCRMTAEILDRDLPTGGRLLKFVVSGGASLLTMIDRFGEMPLPPYIGDRSSSPEQYQTVFAEHQGSAAAPTAGLHFTPELLTRLEAAGVDRTFITLHVGVGTFRPVESDVITNHEMHGEWVEVSPKTVDKIKQTQAQGGRVFAVGTTTARALEGSAQACGGTIAPFCGKTSIFIYPGYEWRVISGLITNFHLPKSSLMMMVSALIGRERLLSLYRVAIEADYRFFSFGDAMLLMPEAKIEAKPPQFD